MMQDEIQQPERNRSQKAVNQPAVNATENADTASVEPATSSTGSKRKRKSPVWDFFTKIQVGPDT